MTRARKRIWRRKSFVRSVFAVACIGALGVVAAGITGVASGDPYPPTDPLGDLPLNPEWLANTLSRASTTTSVKNNTDQEAIDRRNKAVADWKAAEAAAAPFKAKAASAAAAASKAGNAVGKAKAGYRLALKKYAKAKGPSKLALKKKVKALKKKLKAAKR